MNAGLNNLSDRINWQTLIMFALGFWLSSSLLLDFAIVPGLATTGMMAQAGFASAGYVIFGIFNHIELLCAALVLTSFLVLCRHHHFSNRQQRWAIGLSVILLAIAIIYTYILTPQMSSLGLQLNWFEPTTSVQTAMIEMHGGYWGLEVLKAIACATLLRWCYRDSCTLV